VQKKIQSRAWWAIAGKVTLTGQNLHAPFQKIGGIQTVNTSYTGKDSAVVTKIIVKVNTVAFLPRDAL